MMLFLYKWKDILIFILRFLWGVIWRTYVGLYIAGGLVGSQWLFRRTDDSKMESLLLYMSITIVSVSFILSIIYVIQNADRFKV